MNAATAATEQEKAMYRVVLKRTLRKAGVAYGDPNAVETEVLESLFRLTAKHAPAVVSSCVRAFYDSATRAYIRGINSGDNAMLDAGERERDRIWTAADAALALLGIEVDHSSITPSFKRNGRYDLFLERMIREASA